MSPTSNRNSEMPQQFSTQQAGWHIIATVLILSGGITSGCSHSHAKRPPGITVNWSQSIGSARNIYSLNLWSATDSKVGANPQFGQQIGEIQPAICRIHAAEMLKIGHAKAWINQDGEWNSTKIDAILHNISPHCDDLMISIPSWSPTLHQGRQLPSHKYQDFAQWCGQLVHLTTKKQGHTIKYFEILNEKDSAYNGNSQALAQLTQQAAQAIKTVHTEARIVSGAWTHPYDKTDIQLFLEAAKTSNIHAFSYHQYGTHQSLVDPDRFYKTAKEIGQRPKVIRQWMKKKGVDNLELFLGETHIFSSWHQDRKRLMRSHQGAVFLALVFQQAAQHSYVDSIFPWNEADNTYGLLARRGETYHLRPSGHILKLLRQYFSQGKRLAINTPRGLDAFAVRNQAHHSLMIINSNLISSKVTRLEMNGWSPNNRSYQVHTIDANGSNTRHQTWGDQHSLTLKLPRESVTFLIFPKPYSQTRS